MMDLKLLFKILSATTDSQFSLKKECLGGITTFLSMMYIIVVNPMILSQAGVPYDGALTATLLVSFIGCVSMGIFSNNPIAVAPGMGINAFFTYAIVQHMNVSWQIALGVVFWSGILFTLMSLSNIRAILIMAIPKQIRHAVVVGIGLLIAVIALKSANIISSDPVNMIQMSKLNISFALFLGGLLFTGFLIYLRYSSAMILGVVLITVIYLLIDSLFPNLALSTHFNGILSMPNFSTFAQLDLINSLSIALWPAMFAFIFTILFDSMTGAIGVCEAGGLVDKNGDPRNFKEILAVDGISGVISGILGTSSAIGYIESVAGIEVGARTGISAIVTGFLFLPFLFLSPLLALVPAVATAPVLFIVGIYMVKTVRDIEWENIQEAISALLTILIIPLTGSITHGVILGLLLWNGFKIMTVGIKGVSKTLLVINILSIVLLALDVIS